MVGEVAFNFDQATHGPAGQENPQTATQPSADSGFDFNKATKVERQEPLSQDGLPFTDRVALSSADTTEEKRYYLEKVYGADNVRVMPQTGQQTQYYGGAKHLGGGKPIATSQDVLAVKVGDKWVNAQSGSVLAGIGADLVAQSPEMVMMGAGAMAGTELGPAGMVAGGALGAAAGKTIEEGVKAATGRYHKSPDQYAASVLQAGEGGAAAEAGGGIINKVAGGMAKGGLPKAITGTTKERAAQFQRLKAEGARPPIASVAPDLKKLQRMEILAQKISGEPAERNAANRAVADKLAKKVLADAGLDKSAATAALQDMKSGHAAIATGDAGAAIGKRVKAHMDMLSTRATKLLDTATTHVDSLKGHLEKLIRQHPAGDLGVDTAKGIGDAREAFGVAAKAAYGRVDDMVGSRPIVNVAPILRQAKEFIKISKGFQASTQAKQLGRALGPEAQVTDEETRALFADLKVDLPQSPDGKIPLATAQYIRSKLMEQMNRTDLAPGIAQHQMGALVDSVNRGIAMASLDPANAPAIKLLQATDKWYAANIKKFNDVEIQQIVSRVGKTGIPADPDKIARMIVTSGESGRAETLKKLVGDGVWRRVAAQDVSNLLRDASDSMTGDIDGQSLAGAIAKRGSVMGVVHGEDVTKRMMAFARNLAATQGKLASKNLDEPQFKALMQEYEAAQTDLESFTKENPLAALAASKKRPEEIYNVLTKPGNGSSLEAAARFLGENSPEMHDLQKVALQKLLFDSVYEAGQIGPTKQYVSRDLNAALQQWTPREQALLFPKGLTDHLRQFDDDLKFLFPKPVDDAMAGMTAGSIQNQFFLRRWWTQAKASFGRYIIDHPGFQEYLTVGRELDPRRKAMADAARMNMVRYFAVEASQGVYDEQDDEQ